MILCVPQALLYFRSSAGMTRLTSTYIYRVNDAGPKKRVVFFSRFPSNVGHILTLLLICVVRNRTYILVRLSGGQS